MYSLCTFSTLQCKNCLTIFSIKILVIWKSPPIMSHSLKAFKMSSASFHQPEPYENISMKKKGPFLYYKNKVVFIY